MIEQNKSFLCFLSLVIFHKTKHTAINQDSQIESQHNQKPLPLILQFPQWFLHEQSSKNPKICLSIYANFVDFNSLIERAASEQPRKFCHGWESESPTRSCGVSPNLGRAPIIECLHFQDRDPNNAKLRSISSSIEYMMTTPHAEPDHKQICPTNPIQLIL